MTNNVIILNEANRKRAGVIPYIVEDGIVRMMFMEAVNNQAAGWQIAKGGLKKDEDKKQGAFREAGEELGLFEPNTRNVKSVGSFGGITLYIAEVIDKNKFGDPQASEVSAVTWLTMDEFASSGRMSQKHIVKQVHKLILDSLPNQKKSLVTPKR